MHDMHDFQLVFANIYNPKNFNFFFLKKILVKVQMGASQMRFELETFRAECKNRYIPECADSTLHIAGLETL